MSHISLGSSVVSTGVAAVCVWLLCPSLDALPSRLSSTPAAVAGDAAPTGLDRGFRLLYDLRFDEAHEVIREWQRGHPADPMGGTAEAAGYLFEEFTRQGVLTSEFFLDDDRLLGGITGKPDEGRKAAFFAASERARAIALQVLASHLDDADALLALAMTTGMLSNYASLIDKRQFESLRLVREAENYGERLLAVSPDVADAYVPLGASRYIIGCLPAYKRVLLWFGGIAGDREKGMEQLAIAAARGRYLRPYAKVLLFLASLREGQMTRARTLIEELTAEFPANPLFAHERAALDRIGARVGAHPPGLADAT